MLAAPLPSCLAAHRPSCLVAAQLPSCPVAARRPSWVGAALRALSLIDGAEAARERALALTQRARTELIFSAPHAAVTAESCHYLAAWPALEAVDLGGLALGAGTAFLARVLAVSRGELS